MSLKRYKLLITLVLPLLFLAACADKNNATSTKELTNYSKSLEKQGHYHLSKGLASNQDPICQIYVDALNTYGIVDDFFKAPAQPNSPKFGYPKWEQLDIYEHKDVFLRSMEYNSNIDDDFKLKVKIEKEYEMESNRSEEDKRLNRQNWQMYYTKTNIDNNEKPYDIIKIDNGRYNHINSYPYYTHLVIFENQKKIFTHIYQNLSAEINEYQDGIFVHDIFSYKNKIYIKRILISAEILTDTTGNKLTNGFKFLNIYKVNDEQELEILCKII
jgi:hypothetical protein